MPSAVPSNNNNNNAAETTDAPPDPPAATTSLPAAKDYSLDDIEFVDYVDESQLEHVMKLVLQDLSEPYSSKSVSSFRFLSFART